MLSLVLYRLKRPYHFFKTGLLQGLRAQWQYGFPEKRLKIIVITGTDGKTTTATLLHHVLTTNQIKAGLLTTVSAQIGTKSIDTGLHVTAPEPQQLYDVLRQMVDAGCTHVVMEMTSHGSYQFRNWGIKPWLGGVTNITHDHFDYHLNYKEYALAKLIQFKKTPKVYFPEGDRSYSLARKILRSVQVKLYSSSTKLPPIIFRALTQRFPETFNRQNAILASLIAIEVGVPPAKIASAIRSFIGVAGRLEQIPTSKGFRIYVDFAHTPHAVESVLSYLKSQTKGRLIAILGCAGLRDRVKRPMMGKKAATYADLAIFTAEDPRTENVWTIIGQMKSQLHTLHNKVISVPDRGIALSFAISDLAKRGDTVVILGKGHENSMCFGSQEFLWNDRTAVQQILNSGEVPTLGKALASR